MMIAAIDMYQMRQKKRQLCTGWPESSGGTVVVAGAKELLHTSGRYHRQTRHPVLVGDLESSVGTFLTPCTCWRSRAGRKKNFWNALYLFGISSQVPKNFPDTLYCMSTLWACHLINDKTHATARELQSSPFLRVR